jgi:alpha-methylacyl-CoA racemase
MTRSTSLKPLKGIRVLTLALNLPGPAAVMRLRDMGAHCTKLEPIAKTATVKPAIAQTSSHPPITLQSADPMAIYQPVAYEVMHQGVKVLQADLKTEAGQKKLHQQLQKTDVLITSFRPSALKKLGLGWKNLHAQYPQLCLMSIVGASGDRAEEPGHDLTYLAENHLVNGLDLPATLYADMGGSLLTTEAVLKALIIRASHHKGVFQEIALSDAAAYLALPRSWELTTPKGDVGGAHAGYRVYPCLNGRVAVAALEPHFAQRLCEVAGLKPDAHTQMRKASTHRAIAEFLLTQTRAQLNKLATQNDIPMHTLPR